MMRVANKKIIQKVAFRTMKEKRWKNSIAILAIALTSLLFTALFTIGFSLVDSMQEATMRQVGTSAHGGYKYLTMEEYEKLKTAGAYDDITYDIVAGYGANPELNKIQTEVRYSEDKNAKMAFCYPEVGRMPEEYNECAASTKVLDALGVPYEIGAKVPIRICTEVDGKEVIFEESYSLSGYWQSDEAAHAQELYVSRQWVDKNIKMQTENYYKRVENSNDASAWGTISANVMFSSSFQIEEKLNKLTESAGLEPADYNYGINWAYGASSMDAQTILIGILMLGIIIFSGYLIIYNIFYINVTSDIKYYGLLKTVGTTGKQLKKIVTMQALLLSLLGIPIGLFSGWITGKVVLPIVYKSLDTSNVKNISLNPWIFIGAALFSLLVIYISCIRPCRMAAKVSPIEAVRYLENTQYKKKEKQSGTINMRRLAVSNMGRNKKKAAVVIASLSLSLILINCTVNLVRGFDFDKYVESYLVSDLQVSHYSSVNLMSGETDFKAITPEIVKDLSNMESVEAVNTLKAKYADEILSEESTNNFREAIEAGKFDSDSMKYGETEAWETIKTGKRSGTVYTLEEEIFDYLGVWDGSLDMEEFTGGGYAILLSDEDEVNYTFPGDTITLIGEDGKLFQFQIMAVAEMPYGISTHIRPGIFVSDLVISAEDYKKIFGGQEGSLHAVIDVEAGMDDDAAKEVGQYIASSHSELVMTTKEMLRQEFDDTTNMLGTLGGLLGFILAFIGILNFINAVITSILARKQEFAMMQAVGMTGRQLEKMLIGEGLLYGGWTVFITLTLGNVIGYLLLKMVGGGMAFFTWHFEIMPIVLSIPVIIVISVLLPLICYHTMCKNSIIERIRLAEV